MSETSMTERLIRIAFSFAIGVYISPGLFAVRYWMCAQRDELANRAKVAKRERR